MEEYIFAMHLKDEDKRTFIEKLMIEEIKEFALIEEEIKLLEKAEDLREPEIILPFPMSDKYKQEFLEEIKNARKFKTVKLKDTSLLPYIFPEETFNERLMKIPGVDILEEIRKCNTNYIKRINTGQPIRARDTNLKDPELLRQIAIVQQAIKIEPPFKLKPGKVELPLDYIEELLLGQTPTDGRILIEEYFRLLYVNNEDPELHSFNYWEQYFKVNKQTLRNIFNYVFFPIPDTNNPGEVGRILYFKDHEYEKRRKLIGDMSNDEYKEYLEKTEERPELQELKRLEYLTYQTTSVEPRITDRSIPIDDFELDAQLEKPLLYSDVIKEIDEKINKMVKSELENNSNMIDKDILLQIEEIKTKRFELEKQKLLEEKKLRAAPFSEEDFKVDTLKKKGDSSNNKEKDNEKEEGNTVVGIIGDKSEESKEK